MTGKSGYHANFTNAARVLAKRIDPQRLTRLVAAYRDGGQHSAQELSYVLWRAAGSLSDTDLDILQELFLAAPASHLIVGRAVLDRRPAGPAWHTLLAHIAESEDPTWLAAVCEFLTDRQVFKGADRLSEWYALMLAKPLSVRRATAAKVTARPWGLLTELGLNDDA